MKFIKHIAMGLTLVGALSFTNCSEDYFETTPSYAVSDSVIGTSLDNLYIALNGLLSEMVSQESSIQGLGGLPGIMMALDFECDDVTWETSTWHKAAYLGWSANSDPSSTYNATIWRLYYQWILNANKILEGLEVVEYSDQDYFNQIKGECLALRGWAHLCLVQIYGERYEAGQTNSQLGVILRETSESSEQARATVEECYAHILADLDEACTLLDGQSLAVSHYSSKVAWGVKARAAMAMQDYSNAATYAAKSLEISLAEGLELMEGNELYCGFADITSDTNEAMYADQTVDDQTVYFYSFYAYMSWNFNASAIRGGSKLINADTYDLMSETDLRRAWWQPTGLDDYDAETTDLPTTSYAAYNYQNRKYTARSTGSAVGDVAFMRLAEIYLTYAEALCRSGQDAAAQEVFTQFQVTRDPSYVSAGNTGDALAEEIMTSRRIELWGEGFRFYDLKRLNQGIVRGRNFEVSFCTFLEKGADEAYWAWQIPDEETYYNSLCEINYY